MLFYKHRPTDSLTKEGIRVTRKLNPKQTIENILSTAEQLFSNQGYEKTSMQEIVNYSGVAKGTIFYHFDSKEDILYAVMSRQFDKEEEVVRNTMVDITNKTAREKIILLLENSVKEGKINSLHLTAMSIKSPHLIVAYIQNSMNRTAKLIAEILREGLVDGSIESDSPDECAQTFLVLYNIWCDPTTIHFDNETLKKHLIFVQKTMRLLGADIVSDDFIQKYLQLIEHLSIEKNTE